MNRFYCIIYTLAKPFIRLLFPYRAEGLAEEVREDLPLLAALWEGGKLEQWGLKFT